MVLVGVLCTLVFAIGAVMAYRARGWNCVSVALAGTTLLGLGAIVEAFILRIRLTDEALFVTHLLGRRSYRLTDIAGVQEAKVVPTMLLLKNGGVVKLPAVGVDLGNSIRAWLRHS